MANYIIKRQVNVSNQSFFDLISKVGSKMPEPIRKPLRRVFTLVHRSDRRKKFLHYMLRGHIIRIVAIRKYLRNTPVPKLQIGCGGNFLEGWLNADIVSGDIYLNATKKMPFRDNTFEFIFCEYLIEHLSADDGLKFLKECHRILKKEGIIRIMTPDLEKIIKLYFDTNEFVKREEYIKIIFVKEDSLSPCELFNNYMHYWGHKFIYDRKFIASTLKKVGFTNLNFCDNKKSNHEDLANLERHYGEEYEWLNPAEALIIEATRGSIGKLLLKQQ